MFNEIVSLNLFSPSMCMTSILIKTACIHTKLFLILFRIFFTNKITIEKRYTHKQLYLYIFPFIYQPVWNYPLCTENIKQRLYNKWYNTFISTKVLLIKWIYFYKKISLSYTTRQDFFLKLFTPQAYGRTQRASQSKWTWSIVAK